MSLGPVYIVLPSEAIGGAEKRFAGLWRHFQMSGRTQVRLVARKPLVTHLRTLSEFAPLPEQGLVEFGDDGSVAWLATLREKLRELSVAEPTAVFHFVMLSPLFAQRFWSRRTLFTCAASSLTLFNWRGRLGIYGGVVASSRTDVLEPAVLEEIARHVPFTRSKMTTTPGSFVDLAAYKPAAQKRARMAFAGLFSEEKQIERLVAALPTIHSRLLEHGVHAEFRLMGRETMKPGIAEQCRALPGGAEVVVGYEPNPARILGEARGFFSLQRQSNYPSKALLEAMACGCVPIVTDVGSTRRLATDDFALFVPRDFTPHDLADAAVAVLTMPEEEHARRVRAMRLLLQQRFSVGAMASYFESLYEELGSRAGR